MGQTEEERFLLGGKGRLCFSADETEIRSQVLLLTKERAFVFHDTRLISLFRGKRSHLGSWKGDAQFSIMLSVSRDFQSRETYTYMLAGGEPQLSWSSVALNPSLPEG